MKTALSLAWMLSLAFCTLGSAVHAPDARSNATPTSKRATNADRLRRGLPPMKPRNIDGPSLTKRINAVASPIATSCTPGMAQPAAIEVLDASTGVSKGFVGQRNLGSDDRYFDKIYSNYYTGGNSNSKGVLYLGDNQGLSLMAIKIADDSNVRGLPYKGTWWCASVNQPYARNSYDWQQDLTKYDSTLKPAQNYLSSYQCDRASGITQRSNFAWNLDGYITLNWLQPDGNTLYALPYADSNGIIRWYPEKGADGNPLDPSRIERGFSRVVIRWFCTSQGANPA